MYLLSYRVVSVSLDQVRLQAKTLSSKHCCNRLPSAGTDDDAIVEEASPRFDNLSSALLIAAGPKGSLITAAF